MLKNVFYRGFLPTLIFLMCIVSHTTQGVVFSREMDEEELSVRSKVSDIIRDRSIFNKMLADHLKKYRTSSREEQNRVLQEIYGEGLPASLDEEELHRQYEDHIKGARKDYKFYKFFEAEYMQESGETIYKAASIALINIEAHRNIGRDLDERYSLRKIISLLTPHITQDCYDFCKRLRWVNGREGAKLPISVTQNQRLYLTRLCDDATRYTNSILEMSQENTEHARTYSIKQRKKELGFLRKSSLLKDSITEYLEEYANITDSWAGSSRWDQFRIVLRGINLLEALETSVKKLETLRDKVITFYSPQEDSPSSKSGKPHSKTKRKSTSAVRSFKPTETLSNASTSTSSAPTVLTEKTPAASSAAASSPIALIDEAPMPTFNYSQAENMSVEQASGSRDTPISQVNRKPKPTFTRESYAERKKRYESNRQNFVNLLKRAQPIEEMIELVESRISTLDSRSIKTLREFIENKSYKYQQTSFEAWIKRLNNGIDGVHPESGSQWTVSLFDENGREDSASIHTVHTERFDGLDPISRSNMLFLFQRTGFIKWNR